MSITAPQHRVVLTYGRFDIFDQSHSKLLRQLSAMGDELIVGCITDQLAKYDGRPCVQSYETRRAMLERCRYVSRVISKDTSDQAYTDIVNYNVSQVVMRDVYAGQFDDLRDITMVRYLSGHSAADEFSRKTRFAIA